MADYQIKCVTKPDRFSTHEHITRAGGTGPTGDWNDSVENIVRFIDNKTHRFYTLESGIKVWVYVNVSRSGRRFIQTHADGSWKNNLLSLYECVAA